MIDFISRQDEKPCRHGNNICNYLITIVLYKYIL